MFHLFGIACIACKGVGTEIGRELAPLLDALPTGGIIRNSSLSGSKAQEILDGREVH